MTWDVALTVLALLFGSDPSRPLPGRLERACRVIQADIPASFADGDWEVRVVHWDEWISGLWTCRARPMLVHGNELLASPCEGDSCGHIYRWSGFRFMYQSESDAYGETALTRLVECDDARRRELCRELYPLLVDL